MMALSGVWATLGFETATTTATAEDTIMTKAHAEEAAKKKQEQAEARWERKKVALEVYLEQMRPDLCWEEENDSHCPASPLSRLDELNFDSSVCIIAKGRLMPGVLRVWRTSLKVVVREITLMFDEDVPAVINRFGQGDARPIVLVVHAASRRGVRMTRSAITCCQAVLDNHFVIDIRDDNYESVILEISHRLYVASDMYSNSLRRDPRDKKQC